MTSADDRGQLLRRLTRGDREPVLVADFPAFSTTPRLSQLLSAKEGNRSIYQADPLEALSGSDLYLPLSQLAEAYAEELRSVGPARGRIVVVGHCSAAALSLRVAQVLASAREVAVILLQPSWPDEDHLLNLFAEFQANLGAATLPCPDIDGDPRECVAGMERILRCELTAVARSRGLSTTCEAFSDLLAWYRAWLAFILACRNEPQIDWSPSTASVTVLTDNSDVAGVPGLTSDAYRLVTLPTADKPGSVTAEHVEIVLAQLAIA